MRCSEPGQRALVAIQPPAGRVAELGSLDVVHPGAHRCKDHCFGPRSLVGRVRVVLRRVQLTRQKQQARLDQCFVCLGVSALLRDCKYLPRATNWREAGRNTRRSRACDVGYL
jgi:hypothetical protein